MVIIALGKSGENLTDMQREFVTRHAVNGCNPNEAARLAGYKTPAVDGCRLMQNPKVVEAVRAARSRLIDGEMATLALHTVKDLMQPGNPGNVRFQAAKWVLETAGHGGQADEGREKPLNEMSADELASFITKLDEAHSKIADNALPARKVIENGQGTKDDNAG